jgi:hypothetical protein
VKHEYGHSCTFIFFPPKKIPYTFFVIQLFIVVYRNRNYKPSESDLEDDDGDDEEDEDDPANWFEDDQDDGRKGQNIVQPDFDEPEVDPDVIRIDYGKIYELRDGY